MTLLNALTIGGPAFLIMLGQAPTGTAVPASFLREVGLFALRSGLAMGVAGTAAWLLSAWAFHDDQAMQRTLLLSTLVPIGLGNVLLLADRDRRLYWWVAGALPAYLAVMYIPPTAHFFELMPLSAGRWLVVAALAAVGLALSGLTAMWSRRSPSRG